MPAILRAANPWTQKSIDYAANRPYLDDLYTVYPVVHENVRKIDERSMYRVEMYFNERDNFNLIASLLDLDHFHLNQLSHLKKIQKNSKKTRRNLSLVFSKRKRKN